MRRVWILASFAALTGIGAASASAEEKKPRSVDLSAKTVDDLAGCVVLRLAETRGYEIARATLPNGVEIKLKFRVVGVAATAATFLIEDLGPQRQLTIFATGKTNGAPRVFAERMRSCVG